MYNRWNQSNIQYVENKFISFQEDNHTHKNAHFICDKDTLLHEKVSVLCYCKHE